VDYQALLRGFAWGFLTFPVLWSVIWLIANVNGNWGAMRERHHARVDQAASDPRRVARLPVDMAGSMVIALGTIVLLFVLVQFTSPHSTSPLHDGWACGLVSGMVTFRVAQVALFLRAVRKRVAQRQATA